MLSSSKVIRKLIACFCTITFFGTVGSVFAAETLLTCPETIATTQTSQPLQDWDVDLPQTSQKYRLRSASFMDAPIEHRAFLKPSISKNTKQAIITSYHFEAEQSKNIWMQCTYDDTRVTLVRKLEKAFKACHVHYLKNPGIAPVIKSIRCE